MACASPGRWLCLGVVRLVDLGGSTQLPIFGKKPAAPPPPSPPSEDPKDHPGHRAVLNRLRTLDATQPEARLQLAGDVLFDLVYQLVKGERGARIEDFLAILGSVGGHACIVGALDTVARSSGKPTENQLVVVGGKDGNRYYFGDLPNEALLESRLSLLSLTLGAAQAKRRQRVARKGS
jgi:hypothetical protein